jgi:hypothetical protein
MVTIYMDYLLQYPISMCTLSFKKEGNTMQIIKHPETKISYLQYANLHNK